MEKTIKIEKNIPIPAARAGRASKYPLADMEVGDSFSFPASRLTSVASMVHQCSKKTNAKFTMRGGEINRCWRVE